MNEPWSKTCRQYINTRTYRSIAQATKLSGICLHESYW